LLIGGMRAVQTRGSKHSNAAPLATQKVCTQELQVTWEHEQRTLTARAHAPALLRFLPGTRCSL